MVSKNETGAYQVSGLKQVRRTPVVFGFVRLVVMEYRFAYILRHRPATGEQVSSLSMSYAESGCFLTTFRTKYRGAAFDMNVTRNADRLAWKSVQEHITVIIKMFRY